MDALAGRSEEHITNKGILMIILCIDPGTTHSGVIILNSKENEILLSKADYENEALLTDIMTGRFGDCQALAIEMVASYGMAVGETTFETVLWIGHFMQAFDRSRSTKIYRKDVALFLCNSRKAKSSNIRQRILDVYPAIGGGKTPQIGTKSKPGPLYGVTSHAMSALAVGLTFLYSEDYLNLKEGRI